MKTGMVVIRRGKVVEEDLSRPHMVYQTNVPIYSTTFHFGKAKETRMGVFDSRHTYG